MNQEGVRPTAASLINGKNHRPGREFDAVIAARVMGWRIPKRGSTVYAPEGYGASRDSWPRYSTDLAAAWLVVEKVQRHHPGWRFSLLGGDESWGYTRVRNDPNEDTYLVDKTVRRAFGWCARFFGEEDPTIDFGRTHGEALHEDAAAFAICLAALRAVDALAPVPAVD